MDNPNTLSFVEAGYDFGFLDSAAFDSTRFTRTWLIEPILIRGQPGVIGGAKKTLKTSLMVDLAISLGSGTPFLGVFRVPRPVRVAVLSAESGDAILQDTARRVCTARRIALSQCAVCWSFQLPMLDRVDHLEALAAFLRRERIEASFFDPLYLCLLSRAQRVDAANIFQMGPLLRRVGQACLDAGTTPVFVHHASKRVTKAAEAASPPELDDLAYAGIGEYVRQWVLLRRHLPYDHRTGYHTLLMAAGGSAGHSGCWQLDVREGTLRPDFSGRGWDVKVRPYPPPDPVPKPSRSRVPEAWEDMG